jgi:hypothetical protein
LKFERCKSPKTSGGHFSPFAKFQESCEDWIVASTETVLTSVPDEVEEDLRASTDGFQSA